MSTTLTAPTDRTNVLPALLGPDAFATTIFLWAAARFPPDFFELATGSKRMWIARELRVPLEDIPDAAIDRLNTATDIAQSNRFYHDVRTFVDWCNVLSGAPMIPEFDPADVSECAWGVFEAELIHPPENGFGVDVRTYLKVRFDEEGYSRTPRSLATVKVVLDAKFPDGSPELAGPALAVQKEQADAVDRIVLEDAKKLLTDLQTVLPGVALGRVIDRLKQMVRRILPPGSRAEF